MCPSTCAHNHHLLAYTSFTCSLLMNPERAVTSPAIFDAGLQARYDLVMDNLGGAISQVSLPWFMEYILPPLRQGLNINSLLQALRANGTITQHGRWSKLSEVPADSFQAEDAVFKPLEDIAAAVGQAAANTLPGIKQSVVFRCNPNMVSISSLRDNTSKPDGFGLYTDHYGYQPDKPVHWTFPFKSYRTIVPATVERQPSEIWSWRDLALSR